MSDYSDAWYELNKGSLKKELYARECRKRMVQDLSIDDMIRIMFEHHVSKLSDHEVIKLSERYLQT